MVDSKINHSSLVMILVEDDNDNKTETEKIKIAHELQKDGMPAKVAAKLAGVSENKVSKFIG